MVPTISDALLLPGFLTFFAFLMYGSSWLNFKRNGVLPKARWWSLLPAALGMFAGCKQMLVVFDEFNKTAILGNGGRRVLVAHYIAPVVPLLFIVVVVIIELLRKKGRLGDI
jgi:cytochrome bd-type quinol oxidase subunit 2